MSGGGSGGILQDIMGGIQTAAGAAMSAFGSPEAGVPMMVGGVNELGGSAVDAAATSQKPSTGIGSSGAPQQLVQAATGMLNQAGPTTEAPVAPETQAPTQDEPTPQSQPGASKVAEEAAIAGIPAATKMLSQPSQQIQSPAGRAGAAARPPAPQQPQQQAQAPANTPNPMSIYQNYHAFLQNGIGGIPAV